MKLAYLFFTIVSLIFMIGVAQADVKQSTKTYIETGQRIIDQVNAGNIDVATVEKDVLTLTKASVLV